MDRIRNSALYPGSRIGEGAEITGSIIGGDAVIEPGARIGEGTILAYGKDAES